MPGRPAGGTRSASVAAARSARRPHARPRRGPARRSRCRRRGWARRSHAPRAPQHGPQARHDLGGIEGFDDVVVRAQAQPQHLSTSSASAVTMMTGSGLRRGWRAIRPARPCPADSRPAEPRRDAARGTAAWPRRRPWRSRCETVAAEIGLQDADDSRLVLGHEDEPLREGVQGWIGKRHGFAASVGHRRRIGRRQAGRGAPPCLPAQVELSNRPVTDARMLSRFIQESTRNLCDFVKFYPSSRSPMGVGPIRHLPFCSGRARPAQDKPRLPDGLAASASRQLQFPGVNPLPGHKIVIILIL